MGMNEWEREKVNLVRTRAATLAATGGGLVHGFGESNLDCCSFLGLRVIAIITRILYSWHQCVYGKMLTMYPSGLTDRKKKRSRRACTAAR